MDGFDFGDIDVSSLFEGDSTELEFNLSDFNFCDSLQPVETRYTKPKFSTKPAGVDYKNAVDLVKKVKLCPGEQFHAIVKGNFIFGDFIEALIYEKNIVVENMYLSTLSMSQNNIDSLAGLLNNGRIKKLTLAVSNYFYSHEKHRLIKYLLDNLDKNDVFELLIFRNHTKIALMEVGNIKLVMSGSANLRSSESIEQFVLQESQELFSFYKDFFDSNSQYSIINREAKL